MAPLIAKKQSIYRRHCCCSSLPGRRGEMELEVGQSTSCATPTPARGGFALVQVTVTIREAVLSLDLMKQHVESHLQHVIIHLHESVCPDLDIMRKKMDDALNYRIRLTDSP